MNNSCKNCTFRNFYSKLYLPIYTLRKGISMEDTKRHFIGKKEKAISDGRPAQQSAQKEALYIRIYKGLFGREQPLWKRIMKGVALAMALMVVAVGLIAVTIEDKPSASAAEAETETLPTVYQLDAGTNWTTTNVRNGLVLFDHQNEQEPEQYYSIGLQDETMMPEMHTRLMELGYMGTDEPSATYGDPTSEAVKLFERKSGFEMDGILTQFEYALLMSDEAPRYSVILGDQGDDVSALQSRLVELGYLEDVTGEFGLYTQVAVKEFQTVNGLTSDGAIGEETREMLYSEEAKAKALSYGDEAEIIKTYEARLKELGYFDGSADGFFDSDLKKAVKNFQDKHGLIADGAIGSTTAELLMSDEAQPNAYSLGDRNDTVSKIQDRLAALGYMSGSTGYFGENTETAVKKFQKQHGLKADGKVGNRTMEVLFSDDAKRYEAPAPTPAPDSGGNTGGNTGGGSSSGGTEGSGTTPTPPAGNEATGSADSSKVEQFIAVAQTKLGCKYVLGGKGPEVFDCSGFVYWCLNQVGVKQSYMTSSGWKATTKYPIVTSMSDLQRGDVISYQGHVGIYLGGNQMIDASSSEGKIRITNIYGSSYWKKNFIKGCRIF